MELDWDGAYECWVEGLSLLRWVGSMELVGVHVCMCLVSLYNSIAAQSFRGYLET